MTVSHQTGLNEQRPVSNSANHSGLAGPVGTRPFSQSNAGYESRMSRVPDNAAAWLPAKHAKIEVRPAPYRSPGKNEIVVKNGAVAVNPVVSVSVTVFLVMPLG